MECTNNKCNGPHVLTSAPTVSASVSCHSSVAGHMTANAARLPYLQDRKSLCSTKAEMEHVGKRRGGREEGGEGGGGGILFLVYRQVVDGNGR
jgi:hypothetical protein